MRYCAQRTAVMLALATTAAGATLHKVPLYGMDSSLSSPPPNRLGWLVAEQWSAQPRAISSPHSHGITLTGSSRVFLGDNVMDSMEAAEDVTPDGSGEAGALAAQLGRLMASRYNPSGHILGGAS